MQEVKKYRWAPSLGDFEASPEQVWGVEPYDPNGMEPVVFCGVYGLNDFHALWRYKGKKYIWWTGSDIRHFLDGYWLDEKGDIRISPKPLATWIRQNCESWVENVVEQAALERVGIPSFVCPSFLGNVNDFKITYEAPVGRMKFYTSVSGDDFKLYGWDKIEALAEKWPQYEFHLYGNTTPWESNHRNVRVHGRVSKQQFNEETSHMHGAIRLVPFDGFSEILAKSVLRGQYPVSEIPYPHMVTPDRIGEICKVPFPNKEGRDYYVANLNKYPWSR